MLPFNERPLIERILNRLSGLSDDMFIISNHPDLDVGQDVRIFSDVLPGRGPLGGLITAFHYAKYPFVIVVACDLPFVNSALLAYECGIIVNKPFDVVIPRSPKGYEPMHAVYRVGHCLPAALKALSRNQMRVIAWFSEVRVCEVMPEEYKQFDPENLAFMNVNTPEEFINAENLARMIGE